MKFCKKCNEDTARNACGACKECAKRRQQKYKDLHPEKVAKSKKDWQARNPEKNKAAKDAYRKANKLKDNKSSLNWYYKNKERASATKSKWNFENKDRKKESNLNWRKNNPELCRIHSITRRARKVANGGRLSKDIVEKLFLLQKGKCPCCKEDLGNDYHLDHILPLALGGSNSDDNVQLLRRACNLKKNKKHPIDYMRSKGFLL